MILFSFLRMLAGRSTKSPKSVERESARRKKPWMFVERLEKRELFAVGGILWTHEGADALWSDINNWRDPSTGNHKVPVAADTVNFDATATDAHGHSGSNASSTIDSAFGGTISGFTIQSGYTGVITDSKTTLTIRGGATGFSEANGTFALNGNAVSIGNASTQANLTLSGGTLDGTGTGSITITGNWNQTGGTFTAGNSTASFSGGTTQNQTLTTTSNFFNLSHTGSGCLSLLSNLTVNNNLTAQAGTFAANGCAVTVNGNTNISGGGAIYNAGTGTQTFNGGGLIISNGTFNAPNSAKITAASLTFPNGGVGTLNANTSSTLTVTGDVFVGTGASNLDAPTAAGAFNVGGNWTETGSFFAPDGGTVNFNGALNQNISSTASFNSVTIAANSTATLQSQLNLLGNLTANGTLTANGQDIAFIGTSGTQTLNAGNNALFNLDKANGASTLSIVGNLTLTGHFSLSSGTVTTAASSNITIQGDWINGGAAFTPGAGSSVTFMGSSNQNVTSGGQNFPNVVHNGSGNLVLQDPFTANGTLTNSNGTFDTTQNSGEPVTVTGLTTVSGGTFLAAPSTTDALNGGLTVNGNGTFEASSGIINIGGIFTVAGNGTFDGNQADVTAAAVTITGGNLTAPNASGSFSASGNWANSSNGAFHANGGTVTFNAGAATTQTLDNSGGGHFNNIVENGVNNASSTLQLTTDLAVDGTLTVTKGKISTNSQNVTVGGLTSVNGGTFLAMTGTHNLNGGLTVAGGVFTGATSTVNTTDVSLSNGTLTAPSGAGAFNVSGNWTRTNGTFTPTATGTVNFVGNGTQTVNSGGTGIGSGRFNNILVNSGNGNGTVQLSTNDLQTTGTLTVTSGTFNANGQNVTAGGLTTVNGTGNYTAGTGTQTYTGNLTVTGGGTYTASTGTVVANALAVSQNGTFNGGNAILSATSVTITGSAGNTATLVAPGANGSFNVTGSWSKSGGALGADAVFTASNGTVTFSGTTLQTLSTGTGANGVNDFFNLVVNNSGNTVQLTGTAAQNRLFVDNNFTVSNGTFDANARNATVAGLTLVNGGTYLASSGTQSLNGGLSVSSGSFTGSNGTVNTTNVSISGTGTLTAPLANGTFNVSGNWSKTGANSVFNNNNGTVNFTANAPAVETLDSGNAAFFNINHSGNGTLRLVNNQLTDSSFTNAGTFDLNGQNWTSGNATSGNLTNPGTVELIGSENVSLKTNDTTEGTWLYYGTGNGATYTIKDFGASDYFNLVIKDTDPAGNDTFRQVGADLSVAGNLTIQPGKLDTNGQNLTVAGLTTVADTADARGFLVDTGAASTATMTLTGGLSLTGGTVTTGANGTAILGAGVTATVDTNDLSSSIGGNNLSLGNATRTFNVTDNGGNAGLIISANIVDPPGLPGITKTGNGTLVLSGHNTYTGTTTINNGTIRLGANNAVPQTPLTVNANGTFDLFGFNDTVGAVNGTGNIRLGNVTTGASTLTVSFNTATATFNGLISGTGNLTKAGNGTESLGGNNTYQGLTDIKAGFLEVTADGALGTTAGGTTVENGGTLAFVGVNYTTPENVTIMGNGATGSAGALESLSVTHSFAPSTFAGTISIGNGTINNGAIGADNTFGGNGNLSSLTLTGLIQDGAGSNHPTLNVNAGAAGDTVTFTHTNTYTGNTAILSPATLIVTADGALGAAGNFALGGTRVDAGGTLAFANGVQYLTAEPLFLQGAGVGVTGLVNLSGNSTFAGPIDLHFGAGTSIFNQDGNSVFTLTGDLNTETRTLAFVGSGNSAIVESGAISGTGNITIGADPTSASASVTFSGTTSNTDNGTLKVSEGTLALNKTFGNFAIAGPLVIGDNDGGANETMPSEVVSLLADQQFSPAVTLALNNDGLINFNGNNITLNGLNLNGGTIDTGTGTLFLSGDVNATGGATIEGNLNLDVPCIPAIGQVPTGVIRTFNVTHSGNQAIDLNVAATITDGTYCGGGSSELLKTGNGVMEMSGTGSNNYGNGIQFVGTVVDDGELLLAKSGMAVAIPGDLDIRTTASDPNVTPMQTVVLGSDFQIATGAFITIEHASNALDLAGHNSTFGALNITAGTAGNGTITLSGNPYGGPDITAAGDGSTAASITGVLNLGGANRTFDVLQNNSGGEPDLIVSAQITGTGGIEKIHDPAGSGIMQLGCSTNNYSGYTKIDDGVLQLTADNAVPSISAVYVDQDSGNGTAGTLDLNNHNDTIGSLHDGANGAGFVFLGSGTLSTGADNTSSTFSGVISDGTGLTDGTGGQLVKVGNGTFTLTNASTYTGNTTVSDGTLLLDNGSGQAIQSPNVIIGDTNDSLNDDTLRLGADNQMNSAVEVFVNPDGNFDLNNFNQTIGTGQNTALNMIGGNVTTGTGTLTLDSNAAMGEDVIATSSGNVPASISGTLSLGGTTRTFVVSGNALVDLSVSANIIDFPGAGIVKEGNGTMLLSGNNTYTGNTNINNGTLRILGGNAIPDGSAVTVSFGATFDVNSTTETIGSLADGIGAGNVTLGNGTLITGFDNTDTIFSGIISSTSVGANIIAIGPSPAVAGNVTKIGTGNWIVKGNNTYNGLTDIMCGTLVAEHDGALGSAVGGTTVENGASLGFSEAFMAPPLNYATPESVTITGAGAPVPTKFQSVPIFDFNAPGALENLWGTTTFAGNVTLAGNATISDLFGTAGLTTDPGTISGFGLTGIIQDGLGAGSPVLDINGPGIVILAGNQPNTYSGVTDILAGSTVVVEKDAALGAAGNGTIVESGSALVFDGGVTYSTPEPVTVSGPGSTPSGSSSFFSGPPFFFPSGSSFHAIDSLTGANTFSGNITMAAATTIGNESDGNFALMGNIDNGGNLLTVSNNGNATGNAPFDPQMFLDGVISGNGALDINSNNSGSGIVTLGGGMSNTYTGDTTLTEGHLLLAKTAGLIAIPGNLTFGTVSDFDGPLDESVKLLADGQFANTSQISINGSYLLDLNGHNSTIGGLTLNGGSVTTESGTLKLNGDVTATTVSGPVNPANNSPFWPSSISGNIDLGGVTRTFTTTTVGGFGGVDLDLNAAISNGALTATGNGVLQFSGTASNTYTGTTTVNEGSLNLDKTGGAIAVAGNLVVGDGSNIVFVNWGNSAQFGATTHMTVNSNGTANLGGFNDAVAFLNMVGGNVTTGTGTLTLNGNATLTSDDPATISGNLQLTGTETFTVTRGTATGSNADAVISANMSGNTTTFNVNGNGILLLSGTNTYTGPTNLTTVTVQVQNGNAIPDNSNTQLFGNATLSLLSSETIGALNDGHTLANTGTVNLGNGTTLTIAGTALSRYYGLISGAGNLVKMGASNPLVLFGANNTYTGNTTVAQGILGVAANGAMGPANAAGIFVLSGAELRFGSTLNNVALNYGTAEPLHLTGGGLISGGLPDGALTGVDATFAGNITLDGDAQLGGYRSPGFVANNFTLSGSIDTSGHTLTVGGSSRDDGTIVNGAVINSNGNVAGNLVKNGTATLFLNNGNNTYNGTTTINAGLVQLGASEAIPSTSAVTVNGTLDLHNFNESIVSLAGNGTVDLGSGCLTVNNPVSTGTTFSGVIADGTAGSGGNLVKAGEGNFTLSGNAANTYTGTTTVLEGLLCLNKANGVIAVPGNLVIGDNNADADGLIDDIVRLKASGQLSTTGCLTINSDGLLDLNGNNQTLGNLCLNGSTISTGTGTLTLAGDVCAMSSAAGVPSAIIGNIDLDGATPRTFTITSGGNKTLDLDLNAAISNGALTETGNGILQFSGNASNTYSGATTVSSGTLILAKTGGAVAVAGNLVVGDGTDVAIVNWANSAQLGATTRLTTNTNGTVNLNGFSDAIAGLTMNGGNITTGAGTLTLNGNASFTSDDPATISGNLQLTGTETFTVTRGTATGSNADAVISANMSGNTASFNVNGNGILRLSGTNTYTGATNITGATVQVQNGNAIPDNSNTQLFGNATLSLLSSETIGALNDGNAANTGTVNIGNGTTLTVNGCATSIYHGLISGGGNLVKTGNMAMVLFGANNTYTGNTTVAQGLLAVAADGAMGPANAAGIFVLSGAELRFGSAVNNVALNYSTAEPLTVAGSGIIAGNLPDGAVTGINGSFAGNVTLSADAQVDGYRPNGFVASNFTFGGRIDTNGHTLTVGGSAHDDGTIFSGAVVNTNGGAAGNLVKNGTATLFLNNGNNTYDGTTTINAGTIQLGANQAIPSTSAVTANGTLDLHNFNDSIKSLAGTGLVNLGSGCLTVNNPVSTSTTFSGVIADGAAGSGGNLVVAGAGNFTLTGFAPNTYTGTTTVTAGILSLNKFDGNNAIGGNLTVNTGANVVYQAGNQVIDTSYVTVNGTINMGGFSDTIGPLTMNDGTVNTGTGNLNLGANGSGTSLTMTGGTISTGTGTLTLGGNVVGTSDSQTATINGLLNLGTSTPSFNITQGAQSIDMLINANISGSASVGLTKDGNGVLKLGGTSTYTGNTTLDAGTVCVSNNSAIGASTLAFNGGAIQSSAAVTLANAFTVSANGGTVNGSNPLTFTGNGVFTTGTLTVSNSNTTNFNGVLSGNGGFAETAGTVNFNGGASNSYTGNTTVTGGTLQLNKTAGNLAVVGPLFVGGNGPATVKFLVANQLSIQDAVTINSQGVLNLNGFSQTLGNATALGSVTMTGGTIQTGAGTLTLNDNVTAVADSGGNAATISGTVALGTVAGNRTFTVNHQANATVDLNVTAKLTPGGPSVTLFKTGAGIMKLSNGTGNYTGKTTVNAGTLQLGASNAVPSTSAMTVASGATFDLNGFSDTIGSLTGAGNVTFNGTGTLNTGSDNTSTAFTGIISGAGNLTKSGTGTFTLNTGNSTYTGTTTVTTAGASGSLIVGTTAKLSGTSAATVGNNTTLQVDGSVNSAATITVNTGGLLRGIGTVGNLAVSGTVEPGDAGNNTVGNLTAVSANFASGGTLKIRVSSNTFRSDKLLLTGTTAGTLTLGGTSKLVLDETSLVSGSSTKSTSIVSFSNNGALTATGTFGTVSQTGNSSNFGPNVTYNAGGVQVTYSGTVGASFAPVSGQGVVGLPNIGLGQTGHTQAVTVAVLDTGIDYKNATLAGDIWINQGEIPADVRARLTDVDGDGLITLRDLQNPINQGTGKIVDVYHDGYISVRDLLAPRSMGGWATGTDKDGDGHADDIVGWNFVANNNDPYDDNGHGTFGASVLTQVDTGALLMPVKFLDATGHGSTEAAALALDYAVEHGARVVLDAWASDVSDPAFAAAVARAADAGTLVVQAAGNDDPQALQALAPVHGANMLIVGASDGADQLAAFSNANPGLVDIAAPGVGIAGQAVGGGVAIHDGTSVSSAWVAGAAALEWGMHPGQTFQDVRSAILNGADQVASLAGGVAGGRRLDVAGMLQAGTSAVGLPAAVVSLTPTMDVPLAAGSLPGGTAIVKLEVGQDIQAAAVAFGGVAVAGADRLFQQVEGQATANPATQAVQLSWLSAFEGAAAQIAASMPTGGGDDGSTPDADWLEVGADADLDMIRAMARG